MKENYNSTVYTLQFLINCDVHPKRTQSRITLSKIIYINDHQWRQIEHIIGYNIRPRAFDIPDGRLCIQNSTTGRTIKRNSSFEKCHISKIVIPSRFYSEGLTSMSNSTFFGSHQVLGRSWSKIQNPLFFLSGNISCENISLPGVSLQRTHRFRHPEYLPVLFLAFYAFKSTKVWSEPLSTYVFISVRRQ